MQRTVLEKDLNMKNVVNNHLLMHFLNLKIVNKLKTLTLGLYPLERVAIINML